MNNFKFNFPSQGQLKSLNLNKFLLTGFKTITCYQVFLVTLLFIIIARMLCGNHLKSVRRFKPTLGQAHAQVRTVRMAF